MVSHLISFAIFLAIICQIVSYPLPGATNVEWQAASKPSVSLSPATRNKRAFDRFDHGGIFVFGGSGRFDNWEEEHGYKPWYRNF
uniref:Secreted protein n=1 Tax=Caenorhabditis tropicalis TaxID=1561998 RepID=A0A1I7TMY9_9PELO